MGNTVIVSAARTPFGRFGGCLKGLSAAELGSKATKAALERAGLTGAEIDYVLMGMVLQGGAGQIPSRQVSLGAGIPNSVPSDTINKVCISSLRCVEIGDYMIRSGAAQVLVAGGMESMSNAPYVLNQARWGQRMGDGKLVDLMVYDGLTCAFHGVHMAILGSKVAKEYGISREEQDQWALRSQQLAVAAQQAGKLQDEIVPVMAPVGKGREVEVDQDESPRPDTTLEGLARLKPVFDPEGTVTAGNAPGVNDGAGALVLMDEEKAKSLGIKPLARVLGQAQVAAEPAYIATVPGLAINKLLGEKGMNVKDIDLFEVNEAFAAVALTSGRIANLDPDKVNVNGGAIAFGHPIGASGARILMTLIFELKRRVGGLGMAAICGGGAQGDAVLVEVFN